MEFFIDFLTNNYLLFLIITLILFFALVGYIVDSKEQKNVPVFESPQQMQQNLTQLATYAQNKPLSDNLSMNSMGSSPNVFQNSPASNYPPTNGNMVNEMMNSNYYSNSNNYLNQNSNSQTSINSNSSFEVLGK